MDKNMEVRISECVFDLTTIAYTLINDFKLEDIDSRALFQECYKLAKEFEDQYDEDDDYLNAIDSFGYRKLMGYFDLTNTYTGCVPITIQFVEDGVDFEEAKENVMKMVKMALVGPGYQVVSDPSNIDWHLMGVKNTK